MVKKEDIIKLLIEIDKSLPEGVHFKLFIIGGSAACLLDSKVFSRDIDILSSIPPELNDAIIKAKCVTGIDVEFGYTSVSDMPYNTEDRLILCDLFLRKLTVYVPDPLDLILMKMPRGLEKDIVDSLALIKNFSIDYNSIVNRYLSETGHYIGNREVVNSLMAQLISSAYGEEKERQFLLQLQKS